MATQLVTSGNRVVAHGEDCFISMGGTVICQTTGKVYQNATVICSCDDLPSDVDEVGYMYQDGSFIPCAPYGKGTGTILVACEDCNAPKDSGVPVGRFLFAQIVVTIPANSTVTCTKGDDSLTGEGSNPVTFYPTAYGEWTLTVTDGTNTATRIVNVDAVKNYVLTVDYFNATIAVTYPVGAVCTCTLGEDVLTAPNTSGSYTFNVWCAGTWTIAAVLDTDSTSKDIAITTNGQSETAALGFYALKDGDFDYTGTYEYIDDGGGDWRIKFLTTGIFTPNLADISSALPINVFCVGGGAPGYYNNGGGGGFTNTFNANLAKSGSTTYAVIVGAGGADHSDGGASSFNGTGADGANYIYGCGGSGGGQRDTTDTTLAGNGGSDGGNGGYCRTMTVGGTPRQYGYGQGTTSREFGEATGKLYAGGGGGYGSTGAYGQGGQGGGGGSCAELKDGVANTGGGGCGNNGVGGSGIVIIRNAR